MSITKMGYFVSYWAPGKPVQYWNRDLKLWVYTKNKYCLYTTKHGAAVAAGHVRQRYSDSEFQRHIVSEHLSYKE